MTPTNGERLAVLETTLGHVEERVERLDGKMDALDAKLDTVLLRLAEQPKGWTLGKTTQQAVGGIIGAALLYLAAALGLPLPAPTAPTANAPASAP